MILSKEESINLLMALSRLDGFLRSIPNSEHIMVELDYASDLIVDKLKGNKDVEV